MSHPEPLRPTLLLTRPAERAEAFAAAFAARHPDLPCLIAPVMAIRPCAFDLPDGADLVLTSQSAIPALPARARGRVAWCVGAATAAAARARGLIVAGEAPDAARLAALLRARRPAAPLLHLAGEHRAGDLAGDLARSGLRAGVVTAYRQEALPLSPAAEALLAGEGPVLLPLFSPRSARLVARATIRAPLRIAAMSPAVAAAWSGRPPADLRIAAHPTSEAMLHALSELIETGPAA